MADSVAETNPGNTQALNRNFAVKAWNFLKHPIATIKDHVHLPQEQNQNLPQRDLDSEIGLLPDAPLNTLIQSLESKGGVEARTAQAIKDLKDPFILYLQSRQDLKPEILERIISEFKNGNKELLEALARIKVRDYSREIANWETREARVARRENSDRRTVNQVGFKRVNALELIGAMQQMVFAEKGRRSAGETLDLPLIVSPQIDAIMRNPPKTQDQLGAVSAAQEIVAQKNT